LGNKAMMVHYRSPSHNWIFAPPYTIIPSIPNFISPFHRLRRRLSGTTGKHGREYRSIQWGPFTSESYSNVNGVLSVSVQDFTRKLGITVRATEVSQLANIPSLLPANPTIIIVSPLPLVHGFPCTVHFQEDTPQQPTKRSLRLWISRRLREGGHLAPGNLSKPTGYPTPH